MTAAPLTVATILGCPPWCSTPPDRHAADLADPTVAGDLIHEHTVGRAGQVDVLLSQVGPRPPAVMLLPDDDPPVLTPRHAQQLAHLIAQAATLLGDPAPEPSPLGH